MPYASMKNQKNLVDRFRVALEKLVRIDPGDGVVAAFSGGSDSTALVYLLEGVRRDLDIRVYVAHLDHRLRGKDSESDLAAAQEVARGLGMEFHGHSADCRETARRTGESVESAARLERRRFLMKVRERTGARYIATAHHADDNAETVLLNLVRGTGSAGLSGIPPVWGPFIRPLLEFRHQELLDFLISRDLSFREDATNQDPAFLRNRVRMELLPLLERRFNPACRDALARMARIFNDEEAYWEGRLEEIQRLVGWSALPEKVTMNRMAVRDLHPAVQRRLIRKGVERVLPGRPGPSFEHTEEIRGLLFKDGARDVSGGVRIQTRNQRLIIRAIGETGTPDFEYPLPLPGERIVPEAGLLVRAEIRPADRAPAPDSCPKEQAVLDMDRLNPPLFVRNWRPGDRFRPLGGPGVKKLSDFFIDAKVPRELRRRVPLVFDQTGIVWVGGLRPDHRVAVTPHTRTAVVLGLLSGPF